MRTYFLLLCLVVPFLIAPSRSYPPTGIAVPQLQGVDRAVLAFMKRWKIPGGSVAITKNGRLVYARGFGFADQQALERVSPSHRFRIASLSKPVTAVAVLQLAQQGKLALDAPVFGPKGILGHPFTHFLDARVADITIRQLLQHTAGWDRDLSGDPMFDPLLIACSTDIPPPANQTEIIQSVLNQPLDFTPGSQYAYSNFGYCVLGRVIEQVTGVSYEHHVQSAILFQPVQPGITGMQLGKTLPGYPSANEVRYYQTPGESTIPSVYGNYHQVDLAHGGFHLEAMDAHGGWIASATDLVRFVAAVEGTRNQLALLSPDTRALMTRLPDYPQSGYAMGWQVNEQNNWWHTGSLPGTSSMLARTNDGLSWAVLFNFRPDDPAYFSELDQLIWEGIRGVKNWPEHDLFEPIPTPLAVTPGSVGK